MDFRVPRMVKALGRGRQPEPQAAARLYHDHVLITVLGPDVRIPSHSVVSFENEDSACEGYSDPAWLSRGMSRGLPRCCSEGLTVHDPSSPSQSNGDQSPRTQTRQAVLIGGLAST